MIIVAFDLGSREAGCVVLKDGVVETIWRFRARSCGWSTRKQFWAWADNLVGLYDAEGDHEDYLVAVESVFWGKYANAVIGIARLLGIVEGIAHGHEAQLVEERASEAKLALAGAGNASKEEMIAAAQMQFPGHEWTSHTSDALGVALCAAGKLRLEAMAAQSQPAPNTGAPTAL